MRNSCHELSGPQILSNMEQERLNQFRDRRQSYSMPRNAAGRRVTSRWRTGALPSVGHGAAVA
eukprot:7331467-Pyramimonas_sp.AAC.1